MVTEEKLEPYKEKSKSFWNNDSKRISNLIHSNPKLDVDIKNTKDLNSWFCSYKYDPYILDKRLIKISDRLLTKLIETQNDSENPQVIVKTRKIKLNPTLVQRTILTRWFGTCRWI